MYFTPAMEQKSASWVQMVAAYASRRRKNQTAGHRKMILQTRRAAETANAAVQSTTRPFCMTATAAKASLSFRSRRTTLKTS